MKIKPLEWSEVRNPDAHCAYTHVYAPTPFGTIYITWKGWKSYFSATADEPEWVYNTGIFRAVIVADNVEQAKANCEDQWQAMIREVLEDEG